MEILKNLTTLACFMVATLALVQISHAQNLPQDFVNPHNSARAAVGVGNIVWDNTLATYAQNYANARINDCALVHSGGQYGENLAWGSGTSLTAANAIQMWVNEQAYYTYSTNTCAAGKVCGHYTQVVWANSVRLGCGRVQCTNNAGVFIICSYDPRGNVVGQKPY
ncbi:pathogenesis-related protein PRB1-2-like [Silene latifolia]|uniref:pathogenesis-related protein PRB1-2-like n=1 Tax=Silene latifolia TaxID=37657 RepID=UPI003D783BDB